MPTVVERKHSATHHRGARVRAARDDQALPLRQGAAQAADNALVRHAAHDYRAAQGQALEPPQVPRDVPGQVPAAPDAPVLGHRRDEGECRRHGPHLTPRASKPHSPLGRDDPRDWLDDDLGTDHQAIGGLLQL
jgi:hypothetical protein